MSCERARDKTGLRSEKEFGCLRATNGGLNWLANQSRPERRRCHSPNNYFLDRRSTVADAIAAHQAVHRAKEHADQTIQFCPPECLGLMRHSDAAFANAKAEATQAGFMASFARKDINQGHDCAWSPAYWKSFRLPRVVSSTLNAEAQSMSVAASMLEWTNL